MLRVSFSSSSCAGALLAVKPRPGKGLGAGFSSPALAREAVFAERASITLLVTPVCLLEPRTSQILPVLTCTPRSPRRSQTRVSPMGRSPLGQYLPTAHRCAEGPLKTVLGERGSPARTSVTPEPKSHSLWTALWTKWAEEGEAQRPPTLSSGRSGWRGQERITSHPGL